MTDCQHQRRDRAIVNSSSFHMDDISEDRRGLHPRLLFGPAKFYLKESFPESVVVEEIVEMLCELTSNENAPVLVACILSDADVRGRSHRVLDQRPGHSRRRLRCGCGVRRDVCDTGVE